jgi:hypothetical protein
MKFAREMVVLAVIAGFAATAALAEEFTGYSWFSSEDASSPSLTYGNIESGEDTGIALFCTRSSGKVKIFVGETSEAFKPKQKVTLDLTIGSVKTSLSSTILPNEMSGVPSAETSAPASDPIFAAMKDDETLTIAIGKWNTAFPLKGVGTKAAELVKACSK